MANARTTKTRAATGKPSGRSVVRVPRVAVETVPVPEIDESDDVLDIEPEPEPEEPPCAFPLEMRGGRCPSAVFNSPNSPNERIAFPEAEARNPIVFLKGLLAVFDENDAALVRDANPGRNTYIEAEPRLSMDPLICTSCHPKTRWYSVRAFERHTTFAHTD